MICSNRLLPFLQTEEGDRRPDRVRRSLLRRRGMRDRAQDRRQNTPSHTLNQFDNLGVLQHIRFMNERPQQNKFVAVLADMPTAKLLCGQVDTVVEVLPEDNVLMEFTDDSGRAPAITPIINAKLQVLQYEREVA